MTTTVATQRTDELVLREYIEQIVAAQFGRGAAIASVERQRSQFSSFYASDVLTIRLSSGDAS